MEVGNRERERERERGREREREREREEKRTAALFPFLTRTRRNIPSSPFLFVSFCLFEKDNVILIDFLLAICSHFFAGNGKKREEK